MENSKNTKEQQYRSVIADVEGKHIIMSCRALLNVLDKQTVVSILLKTVDRINHSFMNEEGGYDIPPLEWSDESEEDGDDEVVCTPVLGALPEVTKLIPTTINKVVEDNHAPTESKANTAPLFVPTTPQPKKNKRPLPKPTISEVVDVSRKVAKVDEEYERWPERKNGFIPLLLVSEDDLTKPKNLPSGDEFEVNVLGVDDLALANFLLYFKPECSIFRYAEDTYKILFRAATFVYSADDIKRGATMTNPVGYAYYYNICIEKDQPKKLRSVLPNPVDVGGNFITLLPIIYDIAASIKEIKFN